jgi:hypothetical protein
VAVSVASHGGVGVLQLEVGGGRIEEQQVDFQVEQVRDLVKHPDLESLAHVVKPVHRPVTGVVTGLGQSVDVHVVVDPVRGGQLRRRRERPVGDQAEQHPLGHLGVAGPTAARRGVQTSHHGVDAQPSPQRVEGERAPEWP